ncbi:MAG: MOSC domain-containing protein [Paracoccus sp. (in: a-proteobacteria)]|uniref:MOSC domain-containing protein n=1 Tax=Paracoccus sp. TaxID=267 RepID=UPI0026DEFF6B|nr:MOSC domain-containing protein [Paracoccus sp. (in: a-proteobacteria)]MDO5611608.1 MOSC domain-containing protein [Paracoccus sp. (in: a-proteobacteria)]
MWAGRPASGIAKAAVAGPLHLGPTGFAGDEQADLRMHGGPEKAVHHYAADHYPLWQAELGPNPRFVAGGFGENISTIGLTEDDLCIGDVLAMGRARVQISQGRQPCWKLTAHTGIADMARRVQASLRTGWYYRVLEPGEVAPGDILRLIDRPHDGFTLRRVTGARLGHATDRAEAARLAALDHLAPGWRAAFQRKAERPDEIEDDRPRLDG